MLHTNIQLFEIGVMSGNVGDAAKDEMLDEESFIKQEILSQETDMKQEMFIKGEEDVCPEKFLHPAVKPPEHLAQELLVPSSLNNYRNGYSNDLNLNQETINTGYQPSSNQMLPGNCSNSTYRHNSRYLLRKRVDTLHSKQIVHSENKSINCSGFPFRRRSTASRIPHKKVHSDDRPYRCVECPYRCKSKGHLVRHLKQVHSNERPFSCPECKYRCKRKEHLAQHLNEVHSEEEPFICTECPFKCKRKWHLVRHLKQRHSNERPFRCPKCPYKCKRKEHLVLHLNRSH